MVAHPHLRTSCCARRVARSLASEREIGTRATRRDDLAIGVPGEPDNLNPILFTTQVANNVGRLLFDGLVRFDENLELEPDLAESWEQKQVSTIFFRSADGAIRAAHTLENLRPRWPAWTLTAADPVEKELRLHFETPGAKNPAEIFALLDASETQPLSILRLAGITDQVAATSSAVKRVWRDGARAVEFTFAGSAAEGTAELARLVGHDVADKVKSVAELAYLDEPEIVFHLRRDVLWHDGAPFTARDVEFTYRAIVDDAVASPRRADYQLVQSFEIVDAQTIRIVYRKPYSSALNSWTIGILPRHLLADQPPSSWASHFNRAPIGTGPFRFAEWQTNEHLTLTKNANYFRGAPQLERIVFRILPDRLSMRIAFQTDEIDTFDLDPYSAAQLEKDARFEILSGPALEYHFIGWNLRRTLLQDERVRAALAHAIDADAIIRHIVYNRGERATGPFVPGMWFYNKSVDPIGYDPARAQRLLTEAGWQPGPDRILTKDGQRFRIELVMNNDNQTRKDIATLVQNYLRKVGIEVDVRSYEWAVFISQFVQTRAFDGLVLSWALRNDPDQYQIWHSSQAGPGQLNIAGYHNPHADQLLEQLRTEYEPGRIKALAAELQKTIYDDQPYAFLYVPFNSAAIRRDRFRSNRLFHGEWRDTPVRMTKAGLQPESFHRVPP